jgi:hypothetical protein
MEYNEFLKSLFPDPNLVIGQTIAKQLDEKINQLVSLMRAKGIENLVAAEMEYIPKVVKKLSEQQIKEQQKLIIDHFSTHINIFFPTGLKDTNIFSDYVRTFSQVDIATYWILYGTEAGKYLNPKFGGRVLKEAKYKIYETNDEKIAWEDSERVIELTMIPVSPENYSKNYLEIQKAIKEVEQRFGVYFGNPSIQLNMSATINGENIDYPYSQYYDTIGNNLVIAMCKVAQEFLPFLGPKSLLDHNINSYVGLGPSRVHLIRQLDGRRENRLKPVIFQIDPSLLVLLDHIVPLLYVLNAENNKAYKESLNNFLEEYKDTIMKQKFIFHSNEKSKRLKIISKVLNESYNDDGKTLYQEPYIEHHLSSILMELGGEIDGKRMVNKIQESEEAKKGILNIVVNFFEKIKFHTNNGKTVIEWPDNERIVENQPVCFNVPFGYSKKERKGITINGITNTHLFVHFLVGEGINYRGSSDQKIWAQALKRFEESEIINAVLGADLGHNGINGGLKKQY